MYVHSLDLNQMKYNLQGYDTKMVGVASMSLQTKNIMGLN